ncbi:Ig-like domain-containing protein, partial [Clostridioides difficile]|uniref:Ig-like domain-containing protein n=2 Tax=Peptostreptococcaceae TaxID=186804 RepID=UPI00235830DC
DEAEISSSVEVDYKEFNNSYNVTYESSNENVLQVINNKIKAVGVGKATIYAKSKDKVEARRYNIVAKLKGIEINNSFDIAVGEAIKLKPKIITAPKNLTPPRISYKFSQSKLPVERAVTFEEDGTIVGIRQGSEKITISCGEGENKRIEVVTINVKEGTLENSMVRNLFSKYIIE